LRAVLRHHDALRSRFHRQADGSWRQTIVAEEETVPLESLNLSNASEAEQQRRIREETERAQASLDLNSGPLLRLVHFELGHHRPARLLMTIHHLVVDPYSLRILLSDMQTAYQQALGGQTIELPDRTVSVQRWGQRLAELAERAEVKEEFPLWRSMLADETARLSVDHDLGENTQESAEVLSFDFSAEETSAFLQRSSAAPDDSLVYLSAALGIAHQTWRGTPLVVDVERLGRNLFDDLDVSRTVGWFVAMHPLLLDIDPTAVEDALDTMRSRIAQIPRQGVGFGLLRYLSADVDRAALASPADVRLNYLGQMQQGTQGASEFQLGLKQSGNHQPSDSRRTHLLELDARIHNGRLHLDWTYSRNRHRRESIESLTDAFAAAFRQLLKCTSL
jgi:non-ribosomal peptide synthase protein (TIGR01720 family)